MSVNCIFHFPSKEIIKGKVTNVIDGHTIELIAEENESYKIELAGIDSPDPLQPFGPEAKHLLEKSVKGKKVEAFVEGKNRWGVRQAIIIPEGGNDPRFHILSRGARLDIGKNENQEFESLRVRCISPQEGALEG